LEKDVTRLEQLEKLRDLKIQHARINFWEFCRLEDPVFYSEKHLYLKDFCDILQAFYEHRIVRWAKDQSWEIHPKRLELEFCQRLIVNMPPRHGKTRTIQLFEAWIFGVDPKNRVICGSFSDESAVDISRAVRDKISETSTSKWKVRYSEIFPDTQLKSGDSAVKRWSLEGRFFNYLATGVGGAATGKGCTVLSVDDPVKNAEQAFNAERMETVNSWITDTLLSRMEGDALFLLIQTRWPGGDPCEDAMNGDNANLYYVFSLKAHLGEDDKSKTGQMLNSEILDYKTYCDRRKDTDDAVFMANYQQAIIIPKNALYGRFKTYSELPKDEDGNPYHDARICYCDSADGGGDFLTAIAGDVYGEFIYVTGVVYDDGPSEITVPAVGELMISSKTREASFESNSGGKAYAKNVGQYLQSRNIHGVAIEWFHQSANKQSRILTNAASVMKRLIFPIDWKTRWPDYAIAMSTYLRKGKNKHDDAPDATTGIVEFADNRGVILQ
jgi:predicted phage terminase large subunit-like protein